MPRKRKTKTAQQPMAKTEPAPDELALPAASVPEATRPVTPLEPAESLEPDVREGKPSASKFDQVFFCAGSPRLIASLGSAARDMSAYDEWAARGQRIHFAWETEDTSTLAEDEVEDLQKILKLEHRVVDDWYAAICLEAGMMPPQLQPLREQRLWLHDPATLDPLLSGQYDRLYLAEGRALVLDAKTGWCKRLSPAEQNFQAHVLALLVWKAYGVQYSLSTVRVSFLLPKFGVKGTDTVEYGTEEMERVERMIYDAVWKSEQPYAPRVPGPHCYYCKASTHCPEAAVYARLPSVALRQVKEHGTGESFVVPVDPALAVSRLSLEDCKVVWQKGTVVRKLLDLVKQRLESLPAVQLQALGLKISDGRSVTDIKRMRHALAALSDWMDRNIDAKSEADPLGHALSLSKRTLIEESAAATKMSKAEITRQIYDGVLKPYIEKGRTKGWLEEI